MIVRDAEELSEALDAEAWASRLLGGLSARAGRVPLEEASWLGDADAQASALIEEIAGLGGRGALTALVALAAVDDGQLSAQSADLAEALLDGEAIPRWLVDVGQAEITAAAVIREKIFDDAVTVFLEARHPDGETHALGVEIDNNLGAMATDILLAVSLERVSEVLNERPPREMELRLEPIAAPVAAARIHAAMTLTDRTPDAPVTEDYDALRALALLRADEAPATEAPGGPPYVSATERARLRAEFLASPEGNSFSPHGSEAGAISLAIDFCADHADGRPLRWSPDLVDVFLVDWIATRVPASAELLAQLPSALDAWVRFGGRKRGTPAWAVAKTREAIAASWMTRGSIDRSIAAR